MNISQIEENISNLVDELKSEPNNKDDFIYDLLLAYSHRKQSVTRLRSGERNLAKIKNEVVWKRHLYFKHCTGTALHADIDLMKNDPMVVRYKLRFIIATNFDQLLAIDTKTGDSLDIAISELPKHFDFFLPWAGMEKALYKGENPADVKAAEKMAKLFDLIKADNFDESNKDNNDALHNLNVFLTRLLFCYFAEDTNIFTRNQFSEAVESHTKSDGSDVNDYLNRLFKTLDQTTTERDDLPDYLASFPYVNGGLFTKNIPAPIFSRKSRDMLIECGTTLDWSDINPDIFGSMIQAVVHPDQRGGMGMHYTSVTNIMKVIEPLFLDELYAELENIEDNIDPKLKPSRLRKLKDRLKNIKIFDPACGSGNFLIIAFKELRKLEMEVIKLLQEIEESNHQEQGDLFAEAGLGTSFSEIKLSQFYGIELDDFAHEIAILSLWLTEHQMNLEFKTEFGECAPTLPLQNGGNIVAGNACRIDWTLACPIQGEVFILGNPPYLGGKYQSKTQKSDMAHVFKGIKKFGELDYISCWMYKASQYIKISETAFSFVSTNSINQGSQVQQLWPLIFGLNLEIGFAHKPFAWSNNAKSKAAVICTIISVRKKSEKPKKLFDESHCIIVKNINAYLVDSGDTIVRQSLKPLSILPKILTGNSPYDGGHLILSTEEKNELLTKFPESVKFIKRLYGSQDFLNGKQRWCIWIKEQDLDEAMRVKEISDKINAVRDFRENGGDVAKGLAKTPFRFRYVHQAKQNLIIIPRVSSQRREYIPFGFLGNDSIISDSAQVIYDPEAWVFSLITSRMHMSWVKLTAGRLKSDYRYSSGLCYNTFPVPILKKENKVQLSELAFEILSVRETFLDKTLAEIYDPEKMPIELKNAHYKLDTQLEKIYCGNILDTNEKRIEFLLGMYEKMTGSQNA